MPTRKQSPTGIECLHQSCYSGTAAVVPMQCFQCSPALCLLSPAAFISRHPPLRSGQTILNETFGPGHSHFQAALILPLFWAEHLPMFWVWRLLLFQSPLYSYPELQAAVTRNLKQQGLTQPSTLCYSITYPSGMKKYVFT